MAPSRNLSSFARQPCRWALVAALSTCACGGTEAMRLETRTSEPDAGPRRVPGVAVDPNAELPSAENEAEADGIVVLRQPTDPEAARRVVRRFFRALIDESEQQLNEVLREHAYILLGRRGRQRARSFWLNRFRRLDYDSVAGKLIYRQSDVEVYTADQLRALGRRGRFRLWPGNEGLLIRVPIAAPKHAGERLFGDEMLFVLQPSANGYVIAEIAEDFQLR